MIIAIIWVLDSVDVVLRRLFGVKLVRLTRARVLGSLTPDELREASKPDVAEPFNKFITVRASSDSGAILDSLVLSLWCYEF